MNAFATLAIAPLISTWLQPGEGWPCRSEAVSTASDVPLHLHTSKPLKRFPMVRPGSTQLNRNDEVHGARAASPLTARQAENGKLGLGLPFTFECAARGPFERLPRPCCLALSGLAARAPTASFRLKPGANERGRFTRWSLATS